MSHSGAPTEAPTLDLIPRDPERDEWDVIVVGTGMGGSTLGYELARRGRRVLFLEKGRFLHDPDGPDPMADAGADGGRVPPGTWPQPLDGRMSFGAISFIAPWGCGTGGSTSIYGAQLERFAASDFAPRANFPDVRDATLPDRWPIAHGEMVPYYRLAEALYRVNGTDDPLNPDPEAPLGFPPPLGARDQALCDSFRDLGLHPYRSHVGFDYTRGCAECMHVCRKGCKSDAARVCLMPALTLYDARLLPECEVLELTASRSRVTGVRARWRGRDITLSAHAVVVAAGSLMTPVLLLQSRSASWPDGLANRSGQVGRNLMLHASDFLAIDPGAWYPAEGPARALALNDFYVDEGTKLGTLQSLGLAGALEPNFVLTYLHRVEEKEAARWRRFVRPLLPAVARISTRVLRRASLFATIVEDLPYAHNRVVPDPAAANGMHIEYRYPRELRARNQRLLRRLRETISGRHRMTVLTGTRHNLNYGHVCGTCRFGDDPQTSVLDRTNRAHDLDNLYVADASFFPSSGGTNPSLTVAANALRVAGVLDSRLP